MLYAFTEALGTNIAAASGTHVAFYTVPSPQGKQPGVSGDGRLRIVTLRATPGDPLNCPMMTLVYLAPTNVVLAEFVWWETFQCNSTPIHVSWAAEPGTGTAQGMFREGSDGFGSVGSGDFRWLPAGTICAIGARGGAMGITVNSVTCLVEDYGQLGEGDEYDARGGGGPLGQPTYLFPDADE